MLWVQRNGECRSFWRCSFWIRGMCIGSLRIELSWLMTTTNVVHFWWLRSVSCTTHQYGIVSTTIVADKQKRLGRFNSKWAERDKQNVLYASVAMWLACPYCRLFFYSSPKSRFRMLRYQGCGLYIIVSGSDFVSQNIVSCCSCLSFGVCVQLVVVLDELDQKHWYVSL